MSVLFTSYPRVATNIAHIAGRVLFALIGGMLESHDVPSHPTNKIQLKYCMVCFCTTLGKRDWGKC